MITIKNDPIVQAVQQHPEPKYRQAVLAGSTEPTLDKLIAGDTSISLSAAEKIADYFGFDVEVTFKKKAEEPAAV